MHESGCTRSVNVRAPRTESLPFSSLPSQNKLFLDYLESPESLKRYYPSAISSPAELGGRVDEVLSNYPTDRAALCEALERTNKAFGATAETLANIELLRQADSVAVLTGQQTGFLTGPLYSIYKALTAIKAAECLRGQGVKAVPVFWMATEDHDLAEVSDAYAIDGGGRLHGSAVEPYAESDGLPVGGVKLGESIDAVIEDLFASLPKTEYSDGLHRIVSQSWRPGTGFGQAFGSMFVSLLGKYGLVIVDPLDLAIKKLASPIYSAAITGSRVIVEALNTRTSELERAGYAAQVLVEEDYFPLFWQSDDGKRIALRRGRDGLLHAKGERKSFTEADLSALAAEEPERLSPGVMLRPVVQDFLFPTICYFGGGAEIAYFAQNSEVYRLLERPVTPILHRQSFTIIEARHSRTLEKYGLQFSDLFAGTSTVLPEITDRFIDPATARVFAEAEEKINTELNRLDQTLTPIDVTLAENLATRRRKIIYHIGALRNKYQLRRIQLDEDLNRRLNSAFDSLLPNGHLQERTLNVVSFLDRYGPAFIDQVYASFDLEDKGHRLIYL